MTPSPTSDRLRRVLRLGDVVLDDLADLLADRFDMTSAADVTAAVDLLRSGEFDAILASPGDLLSIALALGQSKTQAVFDRLGQGVCVVDRDGRLVWANNRMRSYSPDALEAVRACCHSFFSSSFPDVDAPDRHMICRDHVAAGRGLFFDITASPLRSETGEFTQVVALIIDASDRRRLQERVNAIDEAGRALVELDAEALCKLDVLERLQMLEERIVKYCHDLLHFDHFAIRVLDRKTNRLDTVLASGFSEEAKSLTILATLEDNGITGWVAATGQSYICRDVAQDPRFLPGIEGARSSLTVPLRLYQQVIGTLDVESRSVAAFSDEDRQFAEIFARYVATALHVLQLLVVERHAAHGELAANVDAEMAAPLNDIVADVRALMEENISNAALHMRLKAILADVDRVREAIHSVTAPGAIQGLAPPATVDPMLLGKRILVADDEDIIRETICDVLNRRGAQATMARDGNDAITRISNETFDLILSDIKMPSRTGYEVFAAARARRKDYPVILITGFGYDPAHSIVRAGKEGLTHVLFKPFKVEDLLEQVRSALGSSTETAPFSPQA